MHLVRAAVPKAGLARTKEQIKAGVLRLPLLEASDRVAGFPMYNLEEALALGGLVEASLGEVEHFAFTGLDTVLLSWLQMYPPKCHREVQT
eukprot:CAMPEP_0117533124 /NCGR_PEP_ID=MMETSP0784-20121206/39725_1 /TAXON_ID=39447 /ORGANISM="" /LENGTH=90 /DNA_ID=CAMNT_0005329545 /DNA_START=179 /DNA_END=451 /DNA_ORIENTATION=+